MTVLCAGAASIDRKYSLTSEPQPGTSNPARAAWSFGGVARNVAENLARLGEDAALLSAIGEDEGGEGIMEHARRCGIDTRHVLRDASLGTAEYVAVLDPAGRLHVGVSDMRAIESITVTAFERAWEDAAGTSWIFADCNLSSAVLGCALEAARSRGAALAIDAVSEPKVRRLPERLDGLELLMLNEREAAAYLACAPGEFAQRSPRELASAVLARGARSVVITMGKRGAVAAGPGFLEIRGAVRAEQVDETGAGDALCAGILHALARGADLREGLCTGMLAAALTVESRATVRPDLSRELLDAHRARLDQAWTAR